MGVGVGVGVGRLAGADSTTGPGTFNNDAQVGGFGRAVYSVVDVGGSETGALLTASLLLWDSSMDPLGTAFTLGVRARNGIIEFASTSNLGAILA